jgi:hypothetical protein
LIKALPFITEPRRNTFHSESDSYFLHQLKRCFGFKLILMQKWPSAGPACVSDIILCIHSY